MISLLNNIQFSNIKLNTHEQISWVILIIAAIILLWLYISFFKRVKLMRSLRKEIETAKNKLITLKKEISNNTHEKWILEEGYQNIKKNAVAELEKIEKIKSEFNKFTDKINELQLEIKNKEEFISTLDNDIASKETIVKELFNKSRELDAIILYKTEEFTEEGCTIYEPSIPDTPVTSTSHSNMELMGLDPLAEDYIKRIGHTPNDFFRNDCYPAVYMPEANSKLLLPQAERHGTIGRMEQEIKSKLAELLNSNQSYVVADNFHLDIFGSKRTYEPDLTIYNQTLKLYIDIEIDEPYYGNPPKYSHCINNNTDSQRNRYFVENGWVVIRFSEHQIVNQLQSCCKYIVKVISKIDNTFEISDLFNSYSDITIEKFWSEEVVKEWIAKGYREKYLQLDVLPDTTNLSTFLNTIIHIERKSDLFDDRTNNVFGNYIKGTLRDLPRHNRLFEQFRSFINDRIKLTDENILEFGVKCTEFDIDSKIDLLSPTKNNKYDLYCWRNTEAVGVCQNLFYNNLQWNTDKEYNYIRYTVELNLYKKILEEKYDKKINEAYLVQFNVNIDYYVLYPIHILPELTERIISLLNNPLK